MGPLAIVKIGRRRVLGTPRGFWRERRPWGTRQPATISGGCSARPVCEICFLCWLASASQAPDMRRLTYFCFAVILGGCLAGPVKGQSYMPFEFDGQSVMGRPIAYKDSHIQIALQSGGYTN